MSEQLDVRKETKDWLDDLRPEEVATLRDLVRLGQDVGVERLREGAKMVSQVETIGRFSKWLILSVLGLFMAGLTMAKTAGDVLTFLRGGKP